MTKTARRVADWGASLDAVFGGPPDARAAVVHADQEASGSLELLSKTADGLIVFDREMRVTFVSRALRRLLGYEAEDPQGPVSEMVHPEDWPTVRSAAESVLAREGATATFELRAEHSDGRWIWLEARATNLLDAREIEGLVFGVRDISERKNVEDDLRHQALHDTLTSLPNRTLLMDRLSGAISRSGRGNRSVTVFFLDLDAFKEVNDNLGHNAGDDVLVGIARRLGAVARSQDTVARWGGDEFVVVVEHEQDPDWVLGFAERLRAVFKEPIRAGGQLVTVSASFGIATANGSTPSPESLLRDADAAMYRAKQSGGDSYLLFKEEMIDDTVVDLTSS